MISAFSHLMLKSFGDSRVGVAGVEWEAGHDLSAHPGPAWDHLLVCQAGHQIPYTTLHPATKADIELPILSTRHASWWCGR